MGQDVIHSGRFWVLITCFLILATLSFIVYYGGLIPSGRFFTSSNPSNSFTSVPSIPTAYGGDCRVDESSEEYACIGGDDCEEDETCTFREQDGQVTWTCLCYKNCGLDEGMNMCVGFGDCAPDEQCVAEFNNLGQVVGCKCSKDFCRDQGGFCSGGCEDINTVCLTKYRSADSEMFDCVCGVSCFLNADGKCTPGDDCPWGSKCVKQKDIDGNVIGCQCEASCRNVGSLDNPSCSQDGGCPPGQTCYWQESENPFENGCRCGTDPCRWNESTQNCEGGADCGPSEPCKRHYNPETGEYYCSCTNPDDCHMTATGFCSGEADCGEDESCEFILDDNEDRVDCGCQSKTCGRQDDDSCSGDCPMGESCLKDWISPSMSTCGCLTPCHKTPEGTCDGTESCPYDENGVKLYCEPDDSGGCSCQNPADCRYDDDLGGCTTGDVCPSGESCIQRTSLQGNPECTCGNSCGIGDNSYSCVGGADCDAGKECLLSLPDGGSCGCGVRCVYDVDEGGCTAGDDCQTGYSCVESDFGGICSCKPDTAYGG